MRMVRHRHAASRPQRRSPNRRAEHRFGRNGIYDIRVTKDAADGPVLAEFRGRSRLVPGVWVEDVELAETEG